MAVAPAPLSAGNHRLTTLRRLSGRRKARLEAGAFVIEGPAALGELVAAGVSLLELFVDDEAWSGAADGSPLRAVVADAAGAGTPVWGLGPGVLAKAADTVSPQGVVAVARRPDTDLGALLAGAAGVGPLLVLVELADPGNAGTLVRSAAAAGAEGVVFAGSGTDPFGPKAVRAAAGASLRVPVAEAPDVGDALARIAAAGRRTVATVATAGRPPEAVDLSGPVAVLVGSEAHGLPDAVAAAADDLLTVPLTRAVESLNAAVAGAVVLFEAARQRRVAGPGAEGPAGEPGGGTARESDWTPDPPTDRLADR